MQNDTDISVNHEYVVAYAKNRKKEDRRLKETNIHTWFSAKEYAHLPLPLDITKFSNPDNDPRGLWKADPFDAPNVRENLTYPIKNPITEDVFFPPEGRCWRTEESNYKKLLADNRIIFGKSGEARPQLKVFYEEKRLFGEVDTTWFSGNERGTVTEATKELQVLFESKLVFDYPKPTRLLKNLLRLATRENDLILDSFSGSGTTAQAVMDLNKEDGGNRKFILVQLTEATAAEPNKNICEEITRERVKRAIDKFEYDSGFEYMRVGEAMDAEALLSGKLPVVEQFGSYVFYLCTGEKKGESIKHIEKNIYFIGSQGNAEIYLLYSQDYDELTRLALNLDVAEKIAASSQKRYIVYAPACFLDEDYLRARQIEFVNIPYGLFQRKENEA